MPGALHRGDLQEKGPTGIKDCVDQLRASHDLITKFTNYCIRLLNKKPSADFRKTAFLTHTLLLLEEASDVYLYIAREVHGKSLAPTKEAKEIFSEHKTYSRLFYNFFYSTNTKDALKLINMWRTIFGRINGLKQEDDILFCSRLAVSINLLSSLTEAGLSCG